MDHQQDVGIDIESGIGITYSIENENPDLDSYENPSRTNFTKLCDRFMTIDDNLVKVGVNPCEDSLEDNVKVLIDTKVEVSEIGDFTEKKMGKEKRKKGSSVKKPPKPPRPPRGFSLDASDQKLIRELAELAMIKRARIERMKALKLKKSLKTSSSSSNGSLFAMLFTTIFFLVILFQGMSCRSSGATFQGSPQTAQTNENGLIFIQEQLNPSASDSILPDSKSSKYVKSPKKSPLLNFKSQTSYLLSSNFTRNIPFV